MATNVNPAAPSIQPASRSSETKTDKIAVSRDGGSSSGFAKQTDVKFTNSVDNMSAVLEKISTAKLGNDNGLPQQLREMINNIVTKAFSLESSLGEGLGSAMASERYSVEQLTSLGRIFQQLGNMAEANAVAGQVSGETTAGQLSDALQIMMANVKTLLANNALGGNTADLELVQLTKLAFQVLNNGNTGNMPQKLEALLQMLAGQQMGQTPAGGTASQTTDKLWQNTASQTVSSGNGVVSQTVSSDNGGISQAVSNGNGSVGQSHAQEGTVKQLVDLLFPKLSANNSSQAPANPQPSQGQSASNTAGQNPQMNTAGTAESATVGAKASQTNVSSETIIKTGSQSTGQTNVVTSETPAKTGAQPAGENIQQNQQNQQNQQAGVSPKVLHQAAELENNPLFKQIFSRYGYIQQLGNMAEANAVAGQVSGETTAGQLSDALQIMMANVKTLLANNALGGNTADLELVQLTKLAFQVLNNGNTGNMPQKLEALLQMLAGQQMGQTPAGGTASQTTDKLWQNTASQTVSSGNGVVSQTVSSDNGGISQAVSNGNGSVGQSHAQEGTVKQLVDLLFPKLSANNSSQAPANPQPSQGQSASNTAGQNPQMNTAGTAESATVGAKASQTNVSSETIIKTGSQSTGQTNVVTSETPAKTGAQPAGENIQQNQQNQQNQQAGVSPKVLHQAAELENNPLFKQIFSRYGYSQETGVVRQPAQTAQQEIPQLPNNQQVVDSFRNLAELLLKDSNLTAKDMALLKNFVNSSQTQLSQQDAKQLNLLLKMVQSNVPAAIQQAGQQPGMEGLPKLWAFLQLADLGSLKDLKAKDFKNANKEIKTVVSSLKSSISSEGSYQADGQKSISFVMPLYIGEGGHSYPAYINLYDEPEHEDECGRKRKDTWFRVCVLTDNIGAVDIVCQLFEGNNLNLRINFSDNEIVKDFGEYLPDIRKALYDTSIHLNDLRVGTVN